MVLPATALYSRVRGMLPELLKFGVVGGIGSVIDLGGAAVLHSKYHVGPLGAKAISVTLATVFTYLGSRFWTFKERENQSMRREAVLFFVLNVAGLLIAEAVLGFVTYIMGLRGSLEYNAASVLGTGLGTIFRFYAYRKWVFLAPGEHNSHATAEALANTPPFPDYAPWELDPSYAAQQATAPTPVFAAPAYAGASGPSGWERSAWDRPATRQSWDEAPAYANLATTEPFHYAADSAPFTPAGPFTSGAPSAPVMSSAPAMFTAPEPSPTSPMPARPVGRHRRG
jgi:putative flippase GtrA